MLVLYSLKLSTEVIFWVYSVYGILLGIVWQLILGVMVNVLSCRKLLIENLTENSDLFHIVHQAGVIKSSVYIIWLDKKM